MSAAFEVVDEIESMGSASGTVAGTETKTKSAGVEYWRKLRLQLSELSSGIQVLVKMGAYANVNEGLLEQYINETGQREVNGLREWSKQGMRVKKEEWDKFFMLWSAPLRKVKGKVVAAEDAAEEQTDGEKLKSDRPLWSIKKVWHRGQVEKSTLAQP